MDLDGKRFWVADSENGFKLGKLVDIGADLWVVEPFSTPGKTISASPDSVYPCEEYDNKDVDDNCALMYLNEANLLQNIRLRYKKDSIYVSFCKRKEAINLLVAFYYAVLIKMVKS